MPGMTEAEISSFFEEIKRVFPAIKPTEIHIQMEDGRMALIKFSKDEVGEATGEFTLLPAGKYTAQLSNHSWKATKTGGHMLALTFEITDGPEGVGRKVWDNLNLDCDSEEAQKIALRSYKAICTTCNAEKFYDAIFALEENDTEGYFEALPEHLYGTDIALTIGVEKGKENYPDKNKIKAYAAPATAAKSPATPTGKSSKPSWAK